MPLLRYTDAGRHLWNDLTGWSGDPHLSPFHLTLLGIGWLLTLGLLAALLFRRTAS